MNGFSAQPTLWAARLPKKILYTFPAWLTGQAESVHFAKRTPSDRLMMDKIYTYSKFYINYFQIKVLNIMKKYHKEFKVWESVSSYYTLTYSVIL
jgi:hypothetical protein